MRSLSLWDCEEIWGLSVVQVGEAENGGSKFFLVSVSIIGWNYVLDLWIGIGDGNTIVWCKLFGLIWSDGNNLVAQSETPVKMFFVI